MYDPNPLLTLGKRKRRSSQGIPHDSAEMAHSISEVTQCFSVLRQPSADEDELAKTTAATAVATVVTTTNEKDAHR